MRECVLSCKNKHDSVSVTIIDEKRIAAVELAILIRSGCRKKIKTEIISGLFICR